MTGQAGIFAEKICAMHLGKGDLSKGPNLAAAIQQVVRCCWCQVSRHPHSQVPDQTDRQRLDTIRHIRNSADGSLIATFAIVLLCCGAIVTMTMQYYEY